MTTYFEVLYEASEDSQPGNLFNFSPYASKQSKGSRKLQQAERRTKVGSKKCSDTSVNIIESAIALTVYTHAQCQLHSQEKPGKRGSAKGLFFHAHSVNKLAPGGTILTSR